MAIRKPESLRRAVTEFARNQQQRFHINLLTAHLTDRGIQLRENSQGRLVDILHESSLVFTGDDTVFVPRNSFFEGTKFLVSRTADEIEANVLIPGHRFVPFHSHDVLPWKCQIRDSSGKELPTKRTERKIRDILIYYTFFDLKNLPLILSLDKQENIAAFQEDDTADQTVWITVYDLQNAFLGREISDVERILFTVVDWDQGLFSISPASELDGLDARERWVRRLERGFDRAFDDLGLPASMEETIAYAMFYAGRSILNNPSLHLGGFVQESDFVDFVPFGPDTCLWQKGPADRVSTARRHRPRLPRGDDDSMDAILADLGLSLSSEEVEAYMRDQLFLRHSSIQEVMDRIAGGNALTFHDNLQHAAFDGFVEELWGRLQTSYNYFADQTSGRLRNRALEILDTHLTWLRALDQSGTSFEEIPGQEMATLGQTVAQLSELLAALNRTENIPQDEYETMEQALALYEEALSEQIRDIEGKTHVSSPIDRTHSDRIIDLTKRLREKSASIYVLKVELKCVHPSIWRRIQLPGFFTLSNLHEVLQVAMGWADSHQHSFTIGRIEYRKPESDVDGELGFRDETTSSLDELHLEPKHTFSYLYDFDDSWEHIVTVEQILDGAEVAARHRRTAQCLEGNRACPPEDCGGVSGYERLLKALNDPKNPKHDICPESFDIESINRNMERLCL